MFDLPQVPSQRQGEPVELLSTLRPQALVGVDRSAQLDCVFLAALILISSLPFVLQLGFYGDDWAYQAALAHSSQRGVEAMAQQVVAWDPTINVRPVQIAYLVLSFMAFGRNATPYHLLNSLLLSLLTTLLYLAIRELRVDRWLAFGIALVYGLLPHYETDRLWIAAHQATFSMVFAVLGIYALARESRAQAGHSAPWIALALGSLLLSILSYEVAVGLIVAAIAILGFIQYTRVRQSRRLVAIALRGIAATSALLLIAGAIKIKMQTRLTVPIRFPMHLGEHLWHVTLQAGQFLFWTYCLKMPAVLIHLFREGALNGFALAVAAFIAISVAAYMGRFMSPAAIPSRRACLWLIAAGVILFLLGSVLFFPDNTFNFSSPGILNRTAIASALGASCVLIALAGLLSSLLPTEVIRLRAYIVAIGLICATNCLAVSGIAFYWGLAARQQSVILQAVAEKGRSLPNGSELLLDGVCRYAGPGIVFEDDWDTSGAVQLALRDASLRSDVVSPNMRMGAHWVKTTMYGQPEAQYAYGDRLFVFNVEHGTLIALPTRAAATAYLQAMDPSQNSGCPASREGDGARIF